MRRPITHRFVKQLRAVPAFAGFDDRTLLRIFGATTYLIWRGGDTVFERGQPANALYIVVSGRVRVSGEEGEATQVDPGRCFGEIALSGDGKHSSTATATEDSELMVVALDSLHQLLLFDPELEEYILASFGEGADPSSRRDESA